MTTPDGAPPDHDRCRDRTPEDEDGADEGFDAFCSATSPRVLRDVVAVTREPAAAEDAVADAYFRAWRRWPALRDGVDRPSAWVRRVAVRVAVSSWRKARNRRSAHVRASARTADLEAPARAVDDRLAVVRALRTLPPAQREALVLHHVADLPVEEVARRAAAPVGTVKARLARGRRAMAVVLEEGPSGTGDEERRSGA